MTHELAKKLKDAGLEASVAIQSEAWLCRHGNDTCKSRKGKRHYWMNDCDGVWSPTLADLIRACGEGFNFLARPSKVGSKWCAFSYGDFHPKFQGEGETPEEAVANLYLKLNGKFTD